MIFNNQPLASLLTHSQYLQREFNRHPSSFEQASIQQVYAEGALVKLLYKDLLVAESIEALNAQLRLHRNQEMVRIAVRDLAGMAEPEEVIKDLSDLAEGLVSGALEWHYQQACQRFGVPMGQESGKPQKMLVIGMGKLGGRELNFSSDIDLIFAYPERGYAVNEKGRETSSEQFFIRLGQALNRSLAEYTKEGFVYRVDMRLRPFGDDGSLAVSFKELSNYYQTHGRAWERYALVKARVIAGDKEDGEKLFEILRPFVYRRYVDYSALESLRELKQMIYVEVIKKERFLNIKLGRGGIREVEFIAQSFQLINGGREVSLQSRSLLKTLQACYDLGHLSKGVVQQLKEAYLFLRKAENRLQEWNDQQTHDLPTDEQQQLSLSNSMGFETYEIFYACLEKHREVVQQNFDIVFAGKDMSGLVTKPDKKQETITSCDKGIALATLQNIGLEQAEEVKELIDVFLMSPNFKRASEDSVDRFNRLLPTVLAELTALAEPKETMRRLVKLFESIIQRSVYLVLLLENTQAVKRLVSLCSRSQWLTDRLVQTPLLLEQLINEKQLYQPLNKGNLQTESMAIFEAYQTDDEGFMNSLREWQNSQIFKVAASDIVGNLPVMKVSDSLTWLAESVAESVTEFAWHFMQRRHGLPGGLSERVVEKNQQNRPFMVIGYGKLGSIELGYSSDLDVVFLYEGMEKSVLSDGKRPLENSIYFTRMAQKFISLMTVNMPSGYLYEIDSRLRPNGNSGLLVNDLAAFKAYQENKAWCWEHQALVRTRAIIADERSQKLFQSFKEALIQQPREVTALKKEVADMRQTMRASLDKTNEQQFDLKQGKGGIVDIEFMVQYIVLAHAHQYPELSKWPDNLRLLDLIKTLGIIDSAQVNALEENYQFYRALYHQLALQQTGSMVDIKKVVGRIQLVSNIWQSMMMAE